MGDTEIKGDDDSADNAISAITLTSVGVPEGYESQIYYTLDGSDPYWYGTLYKGPISIANYAKGDVVTVKAQTRLTGKSNTIEGAVAEKNITVTETAPIFSAENGLVTLANDGGTIYYTTDGSDPKSSATRVEYSAPIDTNGLNRLISAVTYNNGKYSAVSKKVAKSGDYKIGTLDLPYSSNGNLTEFYVSNITDNAGNYIDVTQDITFTLKESGIISFDMIYDNIEEDGYSGYRIYHPQIKNSDNSISYTFDYNNTDDGFGHYYIDKKVLPAGNYTITVAADNDCVFKVKIKNIAIDREDKVLFSGYRSAIGDTYLSDSGYSLRVDTVKENAVIYYNFTTDGSTPADPTLDSASANPGSSIIYLGSEKPRVKVKAAVYDPQSGKLGHTYYGYFVYVGNFDIYATDGEGNRTQVGYDSNVGTYDVIYDKTGKLYISMTDFKEFFPNSDISVRYYFIPGGRYDDVFDRYNNNELNKKAHEYIPGQKITLEDIGVYFDTDYRKTWDFDVKAGAIVTVDGTAYCFNSENYTNIRSMPALPNVKVNGSVITLSTESQGAKLYYSFNYDTPIAQPAYNMTEYTGPIDFDRNIAFTAVAVWESAATSWGCCYGISYREKAQFIECEDVESFSVPELTASGQYSDEYYIPIAAGGVSQSVDITVPAGIKYQFYKLRTINENGFNSECEALIKLQKKVDGVYVTADDCWYNIPYNNGLWYGDGPFITSGEWRLTFSAVSNSAVGKKAIIYLRLRAENNEDDFSYPRLSGIKVTPKMDGMYIDVNNIIIPDNTVDELYTYITVNKGISIADIAGEGADEQQAKAVIKAYLEDNSNYDYVSVWRRARNSSGFSHIRYINAGDNWQWTDSSDNLEANTEYVYMAEIYPKHKLNTWTYNVFDRHGNYGWFRTEISDPLYILPEDNENPEITSFYFLQAGDLEVQKISKACTIFATATDNQRVRTYRLEYKLSSEGDEKYINIENGNPATKEFSYYKTLKYLDITPGQEYTFRFTVTDANGNSDVKIFTVVAEDIPEPQDFTVTKDSSSIIITWTPKKGYSFSYDIYDTNGNRIKNGNWYDYDSTSSENGCLRYYIDPTKYPTFTVKQYQRGYGNYDIELDYIYKYEQSVGADDEAPIITDIRPYNESHGGLVVKSHIMLNHHLRGDYEKDVDKILKDYKLDMPWEAVKAAYDNEDIKDNYLSTIFKDQVDGIDKLRDIYNAKESFRSLKDKVNKFSTALGSAWDKNPSAIIAVLENEGLELASEFEVLEPYAQFIGNTLKLIQLAKEKDEMTKAMGAFGDATLRLNYHTYEAVRKDTSTGALSKDSSLVTNLMKLIEEAIDISNAKAPGAFKKITDSDKVEIKKYLVQYLNVQRAKYPRSEAADSNWMKAHVSAVMAALFEQVYVDAMTKPATPEDFLKFMQNSDKVEAKDKTLDDYLDSTLEKQIFRDVRQNAIAKLEEAQAIVRFYNEKLVKNSSYPVKEVVRYLEELAQKLKGLADIEQTVTRRYKDLNVWQLDYVSNTELSISTNYILSFREYQKALLYTDMINAENTMAYVDYMTAGVYGNLSRISD